MILTGDEIGYQYEGGRIVIDPFDDALLNRNGGSYVGQRGPTASRYGKYFKEGRPV